MTINSTSTPSPFPPPTAQVSAQPQPVDLAPQGQSAQPALPVQTPQLHLVPQGQMAPQAQQMTLAEPVVIVPANGSGKSRITFAAEYIRSGGFTYETESYRLSPRILTGFGEIDSKHPLRPGLCVCGGATSVGKTTFILQIVDQIAAAGCPVLYFALEQSHLELISKSLARTTFQLEQKDCAENNGANHFQPLTSTDIRFEVDSRSNPTLAAALNCYAATVEDRLTIVDGTLSMTIDEIISYTDEYIDEFGIKPVVVIDYLQLVKPSRSSGINSDVRSAIDEVVHKLKMLQLRYGLLVFAVSNFNRASYMQVADYSSYKESGGIEYTSDVVWALQLAVISSDEFERKTDGKKTCVTTFKEKVEMVAAAKAAFPRKVELVCLKDRNGVGTYTVNFNYYPAHDLFVEDP